MATTRDEGIVLRSYPLGEADRVVVVLSPRRGRLRTVARAIRKTTSRFGGRLEPFNHVELLLFPGRSLEVVTQVSTVEVFPRLRRDLDRVLAASVMVEAVDAVAQEQEPSQALFDLLLRGLTVLDRPEPPHPDLVAAFLLHLAGVVGLAPSLTACVACGAPASDRFSLTAGGVVCGRCRVEGAMRVRPGLTGYLASLARSELDRLPVGPSGDDALGLTRRFIELHIDRRLSSPGVLST